MMFYGILLSTLPVLLSRVPYVVIAFLSRLWKFIFVNLRIVRVLFKRGATIDARKVMPKDADLKHGNEKHTGRIDLGIAVSKSFILCALFWYPLVI